ncbi:MAG: LysE family translocator [Paracoccaceae bacterium]|nr:LysE family translocator [Paracoccaceae bacterium]
MPLEIWIAFALASTALLTIPGPTVMLVVSYALRHGRASGWATVPGVSLGDLTAMTVSLAGAGAVLAASAQLFTVLKLCGAAYLIWLGVKLWRAVPESLEMAPVRGGSGAFRPMFWNAYVVTALNPKSIVFFIAFVPQFVSVQAPLVPQFAILIATFVGLAAINTVVWVLLVGEMRRRIGRPGVLRWMNRTGAGFLIGAGLLTAFARRSA